MGKKNKRSVKSPTPSVESLVEESDSHVESESYADNKDIDMNAD